MAFISAVPRKTPNRFRVLGALGALGQGFLAGRALRAKENLAQQKVGETEAETQRKRQDFLQQLEFKRQQLAAQIEDKATLRRIEQQGADTRTAVAQNKADADEKLAAYHDLLAKILQQNADTGAKRADTYQQTADTGAAKAAKAGTESERNSDAYAQMFEDALKGGQTPQQFDADPLLIRQLQDNLHGEDPNGDWSGKVFGPNGIFKEATPRLSQSLYKYVTAYSTDFFGSSRKPWDPRGWHWPWAKQQQMATPPQQDSSAPTGGDVTGDTTTSAGPEGSAAAKYGIH